VIAEVGPDQAVGGAAVVEPRLHPKLAVGVDGIEVGVEQLVHGESGGGEDAAPLLLPGDQLSASPQSLAGLKPRLVTC